MSLNQCTTCEAISVLFTSHGYKVPRFYVSKGAVNGTNGMPLADGSAEPPAFGATWRAVSLHPLPLGGIALMEELCSREGSRAVGQLCLLKPNGDVEDHQHGRDTSHLGTAAIRALMHATKEMFGEAVESVDLMSSLQIIEREFGHEFTADMVGWFMRDPDTVEAKSVTASALQKAIAATESLTRQAIALYQAKVKGLKP